MDLDQSDHFDPAAPLTTPLDASRPERAQAIVIESTGGIDFDPEIPSFDARIVGLLVDLGVLVLFLLPGLLVAIVGGSAPTAVLGLLIGAAGFVAATVLYARHIAASGQWFGNHVAGTTVLDARNGSTLDVGHAGARFAIRFLLSPVFLLGYLVALGNGQRRTFHDTAVGSVVTRPPREAWSLDDENP